MPDESGTTKYFGPYTYDEQQQRLRKGDVDIELTPTLVKLLQALLRHQHQRLSKQDLITEVWGATAVDDGSLTRNISSLREFLDDDANNPSYIKTIHGFGYELICDVTSSAPQDIATLPIELLPARRRRWLLAIIASVVVLLTSFITWFGWYHVDPHEVTVELLPCDDECTLFLNGIEVLRTTLGDSPTEWRNIGLPDLLYQSDSEYNSAG